MAINKKLIHFNTFENFNSKKLSANIENTLYTLGVDGEIQSGSPDILYQSIVYIKDTKQQWTHGQLYSCKIPEINQIEGLEEALSTKQDKLVSGTNIKTINGTSILGSGDISFNNATITTDGLMSSTDKVKIDSIGDVNLLQTENKTSIVLAINEINAKTIKNNNSILLFSGFMTDEDRLNIKNENYNGDPFSSDFYESFASYNPFSVYYNEIDNHFYYKDESFFYYNWDFSYLYNTSDELSVGRNDVLFSYNNQHYIVINDTLQDISTIEKTIKTYTNNIIDAKIVYLPNQTAYDMITPIEGVLYLIGEENV